MIDTETKKLPVTAAVYLPWTTADDSLFCITLKIGKWKSLFDEPEYKIMIAEALNHWINTRELRIKEIKITGYLISSTRVCLALYHRKDFDISMLDTFYKTVKAGIWKHNRHDPIKKPESSAAESAIEKNKKLFEILPFTSEYIILLITGRQVHLPYYNPLLARVEKNIQHNNFCSAIDYSGAKGPVDVCLLQKYDSPFKYGVGINYQPPLHHTKNIPAELNFLAGYFSLIKTFDCMEEKIKEVTINGSIQQVIDFISRYSQRALQLIMGINNSALALDDEYENLYHEHAKWKAGPMIHHGYTEKWVQMIIKAFGDKKTVLKHLACICLGDEIDAYGPKGSHKKSKDYYEHWIPEAFTNLKKSLAYHGLQNIPVTTTIKNYFLQDPHSNPVAFSITNFINDHWAPDWNNNKPFIFFDQYTPDDGKSSDFTAVQQYYNKAQELLAGQPRVFVGQTGFSSGQASSQADVFDQLFRSLYDQYGNYQFKIPVCVFEAYDYKNKDADKRKMGVFEKAADGTYKLKEGIHIPAWINEPI